MNAKESILDNVYALNFLMQIMDIYTVDKAEADLSDKFTINAKDYSLPT